MSTPLTKRRIAAMRAETGGKWIEYIAFTLAGDLYAFPLAYMAEIVKPAPITEVPRASRDVMGVMSVRGRLVTVLDLRRRFGLLEAPFDTKTRVLLVVGDDGEVIGLYVDEVLSVIRLAESEIEPASVLGGEPPPHIQGIGRPPPSDAVVILLDLKPILER